MCPIANTGCNLCIRWTFNHFKLARVDAKQAKLGLGAIRREINRWFASELAIRLNHTDASGQTLPIAWGQDGQALLGETHFCARWKCNAHSLFLQKKDRLFNPMEPRQQTFTNTIVGLPATH